MTGMMQEPGQDPRMTASKEFSCTLMKKKDKMKSQLAQYMHFFTTSSLMSRIERERTHKMEVQGTCVID